MGLVNKEDVKNLVSDLLTFKEEDFKVSVLAYRLFGLQALGRNVTDLDNAFRKIDKSRGICVNEQFLSLTDNPLAKDLVEYDTLTLIKQGYKVAEYRLTSELKALEGYFNGEKLLELVNSIKFFTNSVDRLYACSLTMTVFKELVESQIENIHNSIDDLFKTKKSVYKPYKSFSSLERMTV